MVESMRAELAELAARLERETSCKTPLSSFIILEKNRLCNIK